MDLLITVDESKAKLLLAFLKELDFVEVKKASVKSPRKKKGKVKDKDFPYFGMCPDWEMDADELRYGGLAKRTKGW